MLLTGVVVGDGVNFVCELDHCVNLFLSEWSVWETASTGQHENLCKIRSRTSFYWRGRGGGTQ